MLMKLTLKRRFLTRGPRRRSRCPWKSKKRSMKCIIRACNIFKVSLIVQGFVNTNYNFRGPLNIEGKRTTIEEAISFLTIN